MSVWESDFNHRCSSSQIADWLASNIQTVCFVLTSIALSSSQIPIIRGYVESIIGFSVYIGEPVSAVSIF
jgi:hypothetical protein